MHDEIIAKASNGIIDDVLVNHGKVVSAQKISPDLIIAKVQVSGIDSEVNVLSDFNSSFKRQQWTDYVVFSIQVEVGTINDVINPPLRTSLFSSKDNIICPLLPFK